MAVSRARERTALLWLVVLVVALSTVYLSSPASASYYEDGVSLSGQIVRDSIPYRLNIKAVEAMGGSSRLDVSLSAVQDPAGPTRLRQTQKWTFSLGEGEFTSEGDTYRIDAGNEGSTLQVNLLVERKRDADCSSDEQLFVTVPEGGTFRVETDNEVFGTITELPACGEPYSFSSGPIPGPPPCPLPGQELRGSSLHVKERRSSDIARIAAFRSQKLVLADRSGTWSVNLKGSVPADRFRMNERLVGSFDGAGLPWLDGNARFEPQGALSRGEWYDCRGRREARTAVREGAITGNLTLDVIGSQAESMNDTDAVATRSWVRPR